MYNACNMEGNDEHLILYDWLADSATTSHITHQREAFTLYTPLGTHCSVTGVGGKEVLIAGWGTVELTSTCNGQQYALLLLNVLHVPRTRNNLLTLWQWDAAGGDYFGGKESITLVTKDGRHVAHGKKINNHLYRIKLTVQKPYSIPSKNHTENPQTFVGCEPALSWETWHRQFGHVGYSGLQKLLDKKLVDGFNVNECTIKLDCVACTEAKQHIELFPKRSHRNTQPRELTHIDLWGKYAVWSIYHNEYYLLLDDDAKCYITINFVKEKSDAADKVIHYLVHLIIQGQTPKVIKIDCGKKFINVKLETWCKEHGVEIHLTAPYSPSQNSVAEGINCTLAELGCAMLIGNDLPEFLWQYSIMHAAYLRIMHLYKTFAKFNSISRAA
jgi:GAG-pre-integrase domain